jgi:hypothetical protein
MLSTLNRERMSCKACLSTGRLSINDTDDCEVMDKEFGAPPDRYDSGFLRNIAHDHFYTSDTQYWKAFLV